MLKNPLILGVGTQLGRPGMYVQDLLSSVGNNTGNLLFSVAATRLFPHGRPTDYLFSDADLDGCDSVVVSAANWLNPYSDFTNLANRLEQTKLPVFVLGLGAQADFGKRIPSLKEGTLRLAQLFSERGVSVSARGEFSCEVLAHYGIKNAMATGCPSLLLAGADGPMLRSQTKYDEEGLVLQGTRHLFNKCDDQQRYIYRQALKLDVDLVLQSELADLYFAMGRTNNLKIVQRSAVVLENVYAASSSEVTKYLKRRGKVFFSVSRWVQYLQSKAFCVGTRFHGAIAAMLAGTPAVLLVHDSRTLEMASCMGVPHCGFDAIDPTKPLPVQKMYEYVDAGRVRAGYLTYYAQFSNFFAKNKLTVCNQLTNGSSLEARIGGDQ